MDVPPAAAVIDQFGVTTELAPLPGGTSGRCYRAGDLVLKPNQDEDMIAWLAFLTGEAGPNPAFRLPRPVRSRSGRWTVSGWAALTFMEGRHERGRWDEVVEAGRALHCAIAHVPRPGLLDRRGDVWWLADRAVWGEIEVAIPEELRPQADALTGALAPVEARSQVVHSDLCANTLFHDRLPPAIIDFSPFFRPPEYAEGIAVVDAVTWEFAPLRLAETWTTGERRRQLLVRACLFRLYVAAIAWPEQPDRLAGVRDHHAALTEWVRRPA